MRIFRTLVYTITLLGALGLLTIITGVLTTPSVEGVYANPKIAEAPLEHRTEPLTYLTYIALAADSVTKPIAQWIGVVYFDFLFYGLLVPVSIALLFGWKLAQYDIPILLLLPVGIGGAFGINVVVGHLNYFGIERMYQFCINVLIVLSNASHIPYYDLIALLFVVIPGIIWILFLIDIAHKKLNSLA